MTALSILIITYNRPEDTLALLENLAQQQQQSVIGEVLLLNNASTVSYHIVENFIKENPDFPLEYMAHHANLGVAGGRNLLIRKARFPTLLVLDDDVVFPKLDAVATAATLLDEPVYRDNNTAVITLSIHYFEDGSRQKNALPHKQYEKYKDKEWFLTYYFTGAAHLMRRALFEQVGYYPEDFFYGMEEYDLSYRIIDAGYTLAYDSRVQVLHKESPAGRVSNRNKLRMMWYNKCVVTHRYLPARYFYSAALMWSLFYLRQTKGDLWGVFRNLLAVLRIPKKMKRRPIGSRALRYLQQVGARLWY